MSRKTRKLIWSAPLLAVLAVAAALAMFAAQTPIGAQAQDAQDPLGPPRELTATADGQKVIVLEWKPPTTSAEDVTAYRVDKSKDGKVWMQEVPATAGLQDIFYDHTGLMPGDTMYYRVFAIYGNKGEGEPSEVASATTDAAKAPGKPTGLTLANGSIAESTIGLTWVAPTATGGSDITGYKIEQSEDDSTWTTIKADTGTTGLTYEATGLIVGTEYHYRVSAINKVGTGMPSDSASHTTAAAGGVYTAITGLTVQGTNAAATLHWLAPANQPDGDPLTAYKVERSADGSNWTTHGTAKTTRTSYFVGGAFSLGTTPWQYRVSATNRGGDGATSSVLTAGPPDPATHGPAQSLRVRSEIPLTINVSWRAATPAPTGGTTTYRIDYSKDGQVWKEATTTANPAPTTADPTSERFVFKDMGLKIGEKRYYRVIAITDTVLHQVTNVLSGTAGAPNKPGKPTGLAFTTTPPTADTITLEWVAPTENGGSAITGYKIERSEDNSAWTPIKADTGLSTTPNITVDCDATTPCVYEDEKLPANTKYYYRVSAMNAGKTGDPSDSASAMTLPAGAPGIPSGLVAVARGMSQVDLYWLAPPDAPGAPVTGYKVEVSEDGGKTWKTVVENTMSRDTMYSHKGLTGLTGDATRMYRVSAISSVGASAEATTDTAMPGAAPIVPGMPQNVSAMVDTDTATTINVTWEAADDNGSAVTGYMVQSAYEMSDGTMSEWMDVDPAHSGMAMSYMDTDLMAETKYYYRVRAMNANGYGEYSDGTATATTGMGSTELTAPTDVTKCVGGGADPGCADLAAGSVTVEWTNGANAQDHVVVLFAYPSFEIGEGHIHRGQTDGSTMFQDVAAGQYLAVVAAIGSGGRYKYDHVRVSVGQ